MEELEEPGGQVEPADSAPGSTLMRNFAIGSLLIFVVVAILLYLLISRDDLVRIKESAERDAEIVSVAIASSGTVDVEVMESGFPPERLVELLPIASALDIGSEIGEKITLYNGDGLVIVSTDLELIGETVPPDAARQDAADGTMTQEVVDTEDTDIPRLSAGTKIVTDVPFILDGEVVGVLQVVQDIDAQRSAAASRLLTQMAIIGVGLLLIYLALLPVVARAARTQREAARRSRELFLAERETVERLRELDRAKDDLLAFSAHEFRTPLTSLLGFAQMLDMHRDTLSDEQVDDYLKTVLRQGKRLQRVADDFLDAAAIEAGRLDVELEAVSAGGVANEISGEFPGVDLNVTLDGSPFVLADKTRLEQILTNLVRNAVFHGPDGGRIELRVYADERLCHFDVVDDGPGIAPGDVGKLFSKFERGEGRSRGSGLGLYISRHLAEAQGGSLELVSDAPKTTFRVSIPLEHAAQVPLRERSEPVSVADTNA